VNPAKAKFKTNPKDKPAFNAQAFLDSAGMSRKIVECRKGQKVYSQGDPAASVMYIQEGSVKLSVINKVGKEAVAGILGQDDFFGEGCLAGQHIRMGTATAITATTLLVIEKKEMVRVLRMEPTLSERFMSYVLSRNVRIEEDLVDQLFNSSEKRLARNVAAPRPLRQEISTGKDASPRIARYAGGNDWHNADAGEFFHEQVPETQVHPIQRRA